MTSNWLNFKPCSFFFTFSFLKKCNQPVTSIPFPFPNMQTVRFQFVFRFQETVEYFGSVTSELGQLLHSKLDLLMPITEPITQMHETKERNQELLALCKLDTNNANTWVLQENCICTNNTVSCIAMTTLEKVTSPTIFSGTLTMLLYILVVQINNLMTVILIDLIFFYWAFIERRASCIILNNIENI